MKLYNADKKITVLLEDSFIKNNKSSEYFLCLKEALEALKGYEFIFFDNHSDLISAFLKNPPFLCLNLCDSGYRNNWFHELHIPAFLEMLDIPYSGADPFCLGACLDKSFVRAIASQMDIFVPDEILITQHHFLEEPPWGFPSFIKANLGDGSEGIPTNAIAYSSNELTKNIHELQKTMPQSPILIQEFLSGPEYTVGIIGNGEDMECLPIIEIDYGQTNGKMMHDHELKKYRGIPPWLQKATLNKEDREILEEYSKKLFRRLGCRDYARFDFRRGKTGEIKLIEVNPNPEWFWDGEINIMASFNHMTYSDLFQKIIEAGLKRYEKEISHRR